ncbi:extracellular solute-binding protein [Acuticoccus sp. MNP-M23]|uniref:extracellular solute-binding protein n=1 Tax=Acuticoccus sp. MNP-M23 TaxID=3072793 RepID=UPI00281593C3|nr:extracellular solute-binding protein [Acuticoccus sp. MNP-M23]WMS42692.1 extracellular solute-binding protein [Acuticoccus sp. MNP-M23]
MRILMVLALLCATTAGGKAASLTLSCLDVGRSLAACQSAAADFAKLTGHTVRVVKADAVGRSALERYQALFSVESPRIDVLQYPDGWGPTLSGDLVELTPLTDAAAYIGGSSAAFRGRRIGWPQHLGIVVLLVRSEVVGENVNVWSRLREQLLVAPTDGASGLSLGAADPTLFAFFLDWIYGLGANDLGDRATVENALAVLSELVGTVARPGAAGASAADGTAQFVDGQSAALLTGSARANRVEDTESAVNIAARALPRPEAAEAPVLATVWYAGVSRYSAAPDAAEALAAYLASPQTQAMAAKNFGLAPTYRALYRDPAVRDAGPILAQIADVAANIRTLPVNVYGLNFLDLADSVAETVRGLLRGEVDAASASASIARAARRAQRLTE